MKQAEYKPSSPVSVDEVGQGQAEESERRYLMAPCGQREDPCRFDQLASREGERPHCAHPMYISYSIVKSAMVSSTVACVRFVMGCRAAQLRTRGSTHAHITHKHTCPHTCAHNAHRTSHITHHTSRITHHASRITHHASHIAHYTSHITHHASRITHHTSHITCTGIPHADLMHCPHTASCSHPIQGLLYGQRTFGASERDGHRRRLCDVHVPVN